MSKKQQNQLKANLREKALVKVLKNPALKKAVEKSSGIDQFALNLVAHFSHFLQLPLSGFAKLTSVLPSPRKIREKTLLHSIEHEFGQTSGVLVNKIMATATKGMLKGISLRRLMAHIENTPSAKEGLELIFSQTQHYITMVVDDPDKISNPQDFYHKARDIEHQTGIASEDVLIGLTILSNLIRGLLSGSLQHDDAEYFVNHQIIKPFILNIYDTYLHSCMFQAFRENTIYHPLADFTVLEDVDLLNQLMEMIPELKSLIENHSAKHPVLLFRATDKNILRNADLKLMFQYPDLKITPVEKSDLLSEDATDTPLACAKMV